MKGFCATSESVTEGHPDKLCDQISDGILDTCLEQDSNARVAIETMASKDTIMVAGELTTTAKFDVVSRVREIVKNVGYTHRQRGMDGNTCLILTNIHHQSEDIAQSVDKKGGSGWKPSGCGCRWIRDESAKGRIGAGDQGMMVGYASQETINFMPLPYVLASKMAMRLAEIRKSGKVPWLYPDGKTQVSVAYDAFGHPKKVTSIIVSAQHEDAVPSSVLEKTLRQEIVEAVVDPALITAKTQIKINPSGRFVIGGPAGDTGLTGRKLMVDTYGSIARHGGGAFSGKDGTKVDRTGAYMARYVAKNIVAAGLAERCEVVVAYAIGQVEPEMVEINTFDTEKVPLESLYAAVMEVFSFRVADMIEHLDLRVPQFLKTASYGHFGRDGFAWEKTDRAALLLNILGKR